MKRKTDALPERIKALKDAHDVPPRHVRRFINKFTFIEATQAALDEFSKAHPYNRLSISQKQKYIDKKRAELTALLDEYDSIIVSFEPPPKPKRAQREQPGA